MKIRVVGSKLFHANRHTDMTKLIVAFHNFANVPKIMFSVLDLLHFYTHQISLNMTDESQNMLLEVICKLFINNNFKKLC